MNILKMVKFENTIFHGTVGFSLSLFLGLLFVKLFWPKITQDFIKIYVNPQNCPNYRSRFQKTVTILQQNSKVFKSLVKLIFNPTHHSWFAQGSNYYFFLQRRSLLYGISVNCLKDSEEMVEKQTHIKKQRISQRG